MSELGWKEYQSRRQWRKRTPKVWISSVCCVKGRMWAEWIWTNKIGEVDYTLEKSRGNIDPDGCFTSFQVNLGPGVSLTCWNFKLCCYDYFSYYFYLGESMWQWNRTRWHILSRKHGAMGASGALFCAYYKQEGVCKGGDQMIMSCTFSALGLGK